MMGECCLGEEVGAVNESGAGRFVREREREWRTCEWRREPRDERLEANRG